MSSVIIKVSLKMFKNILLGKVDKLGITESYTYTIPVYVYCRKLYNLFLRALIKCRKKKTLVTFLVCFVASSNK